MYLTFLICKKALLKVSVLREPPCRLNFLRAYQTVQPLDSPCEPCTHLQEESSYSRRRLSSRSSFNTITCVRDQGT